MLNGQQGAFLLTDDYHKGVGWADVIRRAI